MQGEPRRQINIRHVLGVEVRRHDLVNIVLLAAAYYLSARLGLSTGFLKGNVTAVWPPTGLALAVLIVFGTRLWPGVAIGALLVNGLSDVPFPAACGMAVGNTLEAVVGATLLRRSGPFSPSLSKVRDVLALVVLAAGVSTLVSATFGVASLWAAGVLADGEIWSTWRVWVLGDAVGDLVVAPALMLMLGTPRVHHTLAGRLERLLLLTGVVATTSFAFYRAAGYPYLILPLVTWAAVRFGPRGASAAIVAVSAVAVVATADGHGPFAAATSTDALWMLDTFLAVVAVTALILAAVVSERDEVQKALRDANLADLRASEERFRMLVDGVSDYAIFILDVEGRVVSWNAGAERIKGYAAHEIVGQSFARFYTSADVEAGKPGEALQIARTDGRFEDEAWRVRADGSRFWASVVITPLRKDGEVVGFAKVTRDITERKLAAEMLAHQAAHDVLTGLPNRTLLVDRVTHALARRARHPCPTSILFLDLDRFKLLNDSLGHAAGDQLLIEVGRRLVAGTRPGDTVARLGGDEFVVVCEDLDRHGAAAMAKRLASFVESTVTLDSNEVTPTVSIGIAVSSTYNDGRDTADSLLRDADAARYKAKDRGRARFEMFDAAMHDDVQARLETENLLRRALERDELVVHFQPIVDVATGKVGAVEAVARSPHPTRGLLPPCEFIAIAEETGLIVALGTSVLATACAHVARWRALHPELASLGVSVNLAARQLSPDLIDIVREVLAETGLPADALCLEITESVLLEDGESAAEVLTALKSLGVRIGVDDFGTGFSSLTYLRRFPVDVIKIDQSFVAGLGTSREDRIIVSGVIDLASALGIATVAEGVETSTQLEELKGLGCEQAQGYLWSRPVAECELLAWIGSIERTNGAPVRQS